MALCLRVPDVRNHFLLAFGSEQLKQLELEFVALRRQDGPIYRVGDPIDHLFFCETGLGSTLALVPNGRGRTVELLTFGGPYGVIGTHTMFLRRESLYEYRTRIDQRGWKVSRTSLDQAMDKNPAFRTQIADMIRLVNGLVKQVAVCRTEHSAEERFCRQILVISDALATDRIDLSLTTLFQMVPMSKAVWYNQNGLAEALANVVTFKGRSLQIRDRGALERLACPCFREAVSERARLIKEMQRT